MNKNELPEEKGFSERNIKRMLRFQREYPELQQAVVPKVPQSVAQFPSTAGGSDGEFGDTPAGDA